MYGWWGPGWRGPGWRDRPVRLHNPISALWARIHYPAKRKTKWRHPFNTIWSRQLNMKSIVPSALRTLKNPNASQTVLIISVNSAYKGWKRKETTFSNARFVESSLLFQRVESQLFQRIICWFDWSSNHLDEKKNVTSKKLWNAARKSCKGRKILLQRWRNAMLIAKQNVMRWTSAFNLWC